MSKKYINRTLLFLLLVTSLIYITSLLNKTIVKESFTNQRPIITLMGDSILENSSYVGNEDSVQANLNKKTKDKVINLARDDALIYDIYTQLDQIHYDYNNENNSIVLSVGGNNLLLSIEFNKKDSHVQVLFSQYMELVKAIKTKMNKVKLILCDCYYSNCKDTKINNIVTKWNTLLYNFANKEKIKVIKISSDLTSSFDYVNDIEPSEKGSKKIADAIVAILN